MTLALPGQEFSVEKAARYFDLARSGLDKEFPNKPGHVFRSAEDVRPPKEVTPVFYGHFDWHSSVHGHWTLVRLLRLFPKLEKAAEVRSILGQRFTKEKLAREAAYLKANKSFERMYGWAWALRLGMELRQLEDAEGKKWATNFAPVEMVIAAHLKSYLPKLGLPIRCGFHPETAFPLSQIWDWAKLSGDVELVALVEKKARQFYGDDHEYPVRYEPSGHDFFSPAMNVADLMRRVLAPEEFREWFDKYLSVDDLGGLAEPVTSPDLDDGHLVHLVGLNLTRAWTMHAVADALLGADQEKLRAVARAHAEAGLSNVFSGSYAGEHWLGSFAVYLETRVGR